MRNSNTSPKSIGGLATFQPLFVVALALLVAIRADCLDPNRAVSRYIHDTWDEDQGFPGGAVYAISQTPDGYLWIGAEKGLVRFDGYSFRLFTGKQAAGLPPGAIQELATDDEGNLWVKQQSMMLLRYHDNRFENALPDPTLGFKSVTATCRGPSGELLFLVPSIGVVRYSHNTLQTLPFSHGTPNLLVISLAVSKSGKIWLGARDAGLFSLQQGRLSKWVEGLPDRKINTILPIDSRQLWIGTDNGVVRWDGSHLTRAGIPPDIEHRQIFALTKDRESNIWVGGGAGLIRVDPGGRSAIVPISSDDSSVNTIFEDREGNLWVGTNQGLERFRDSAFIAYSSAGSSSAKDSGGPLYADDEGRVWSTSPDGRLMWRRGADSGYVDTDFQGDTIYSISGDKGDLWVGRKRGGLTMFRCHPTCLAEKTYTRSEGLAQNAVYSVHQCADGEVWAGTLTGGVTKIANGKLTTYTTADGLISNTINAIAESPDGIMLFATPDGLSTLSSNGWQSYRGVDGLPLAAVNCVLVDATGIIWIGTSKGLAFLKSGHVHSVNASSQFLSEKILGLASDHHGWLWVGTPKDIFRVNERSLLEDDVGPPQVRVYGLADGLLRGTMSQRDRSMVADSLGRIWFSTTRGALVVDPARLEGESVPAIVHIGSASCDGAVLSARNKANDVLVPPMPTRITISYVGLSLTDPQGVRYRYKLDNFDRDWSEPTAAREVMYTNLSPGTYRFRVVASNAHGIWNSREATLGVDVEPAFWQSWWFRSFGILALALTAIAIYRLRLRQITNQIDLRFEERLAERTRIAQDLHDTLLQGFLSASMQLHVAFGRLEDGSPAKPPLARAIELMAKAGKDGRAALRHLRPSQSDDFNLEKALSSIPNEIAIPPEICFKIGVEGRRRSLRPLLCDDIYRICREAIINAVRHSRAAEINVEIAYAQHELRVHVQDNGRGMDAHLLEFGRDGHWGFIGMRERAERIGTKLSVLSSPGAGTEVILSIPGHIAFDPEPGAERQSWIQRFRSKWWGDKV